MAESCPGLSSNTVADSEGVASGACHLPALLTAEWWVVSWREIWAAYLLGITYATINRKLIPHHSNEQILQEQKTHTHQNGSITNFSNQQASSYCILGTHIALCFQLNFILKNRKDKELILYRQFGFKSCLAVGQKQKKQLALYLVIYLYASAPHFRNNSKGPNSFHASCC